MGGIVDFLQRTGGLLGQLGARIHFSGAGLHGHDRGVGAVLDLADQCRDLLGGTRGALRQLANLVRDDGKALALFAGPSRLDGRVQGQEVGLFRYVVDRLHNGPDLIALGTQLGDARRGGIDGALDPGHPVGRLLDRLFAGRQGCLDPLVERRHLGGVPDGPIDGLGRGVEGARGFFDAAPR